MMRWRWKVLGLIGCIVFWVGGGVWGNLGWVFWAVGAGFEWCAIEVRMLSRACGADSFL